MKHGQIIARRNVANAMLCGNPMRNSRAKAKNRSQSKNKLALMRQYLRFFTPHPHLSQMDEGDFYYDQPSPLKYVPSEASDGTTTPLPRA
jgi:hypothetical protein